MLTVYLLRHGETTYNADGNRYCGRTDADLTEKGFRQAENAANALKGIEFDAIYSSPLKRAFITAEISSGNKMDVIKDSRLIELDFGSWEGKTRDEFVEESPELWSKWNENPAKYAAGGNGENATELIDRLDDFFAEALLKHNGGNILLVAHNGVNRLFLAHMLGMPLRNYRRIVQENSAVTVFSLDEIEGFSLLKLNTY